MLVRKEGFGGLRGIPSFVSLVLWGSEKSESGTGGGRLLSETLKMGKTDVKLFWSFVLEKWQQRGFLYLKVASLQSSLPVC